MAWDLWSSSCDQVFYDGNNSEWQCDYFGWGRDAIEEDALNEESCVQVLRILITKADTEIEELENDLLSLQNELAWTELENWPDICCSALNERINRLDVAVSTLKSDHTDDTETQLLLHSKPAETLSEIVKVLQRDHCQDAHGQHLDANILNPIVNVTEHALDNDSNNIDSNGITREEENEHYGNSENPSSTELLLELHEKTSDDPEKTEELLAISLVRSPDLGDLSCKPGHSDGMTLSDTLDDKVTEQSQRITTDTDKILNPFSSKGNGHIPSEAKDENTTENVCSDGYRFANGIKGRKMYDSRFGTAQQHENGNSDLDRKLCDFAPKTARRARRKESKVAPDEDLESMNIPLQVVYPQKWCFADTELSAFKGTNGNDSLHAINIEKATCINDENSALNSLPGMQTKNALCTGLHLTDEEKPQVQDLKFEIAANLSKYNMRFPSRLKAQGKKKPELDACSSRELLDSPTEFIPSTSKNVSTKRQRKSKTCTAGVILNESMNRKITKKAAQPGQHETEGAIVPHDSKFSAKEPLDSPMEIIPITSENVSTKRQRKSKTCTSGVVLNESMNRKITRTAVQPGQHETEGHAIVLYDSNFSESQKKRASMLPVTSEIQNSTVNLDKTSSDRVPMDNGSQDNSKSCSLVDFHNESPSLLPVTLTNLKWTDLLTKKKLIDLRAMAKQHNIRQYYKLPKGALVEQLVERLSSC